MVALAEGKFDLKNVHGLQWAPLAERALGLVPRQFPLALNRPGKFTVELQATDRISKKTAKLSLPLTSVEQKSNRGAAEK